MKAGTSRKEWQIQEIIQVSHFMNQSDSNFIMSMFGFTKEINDLLSITKFKMYWLYYLKTRSKFSVNINDF